MTSPGIDRAAAEWATDAAAEQDDRSLLAAHVAGDPSAFPDLIRRHRNRLWAAAIRTLGDREEAEDAVQEALLSAFRHADGYRGDAAVTTWLHRIVLNACVDRLRRRRTRPTVPLVDLELAVRRDEHAAVEVRLIVHGALALLPEPQRAAIILVDLQDLSVAQAAEILGAAEGTIKSRCSRGRTALARILNGEELPPDEAVAQYPGPGGNPSFTPDVHSSTPWPRSADQDLYGGGR